MMNIPLERGLILLWLWWKKVNKGGGESECEEERNDLPCRGSNPVPSKVAATMLALKPLCHPTEVTESLSC